MRYIIFGYNGRNTLGQIRSLGVKGISPIVVLIGKHGGVCETSRYCGVVHHVSDVQEGIEILLSKYASIEEKAVIYTDSDGVVGALNENYDRLNPFFFFFSAGKEGRLNSWLDKYEQLKLAESVGFNIPQTSYWHHGDPMPSIPYPVFTKATNSLKDGWKQSAHICNNESELREVLAVFDEIEGGDLLVQQMVSKKDELYFEGFSILGGKEVYIPLYGGYYRLQPTSYGTYEWLASYRHGEEFLEKLNKLFREVHYEGIFEVEFLLDERDNLYFMEINFRETAFNHVHTLMGINLTWMYAQSVLKGSVVKEANPIKEPFVFMNEFADFMLYVLHGKVSIKKWIKDIRHCDAFIFYDKHDCKPFLYELCRFINSMFAILLKKVIKIKS